ncbi:MAG TPA: transposase [Solirubrobacterales bacterium]|nr:transposase [Solirubrobacterales bacterium]
MPRLPARFAALVRAFAPVFLQQRTWRHAELLLIGAILAPGKRTVTSVLRIAGLGRERRFTNYHRVLNRVAWSPRAASRLLFGLLLDAFAPTGPVVLGIDDTIERRRGKRISAKGIYRDPVRSSKGHFVKASGLRWLSLMLLAPIPWAGRVWALPFLTALAPSERYCRQRGRRHKKLTDWARQVALQARRWLPGREVVLVGDNSFAALDLLAALVRHGLICVTRLRLDAALYEPAPPRRPGTVGRPRTKGARLPNLSAVLADAGTRWAEIAVPGWYGEGERVVEVCSGTAVWRHAGSPVVPIRWVLLRDPRGRFDPQALLCTDPARDPLQIVRWFVRRWRVEVTFREVRDHLGVETQRQWSDRAIARATPCLLALFSLVSLLAARLDRHARTAVSTDAWYRKPRPTFADTLAAVRRQLWREQGFLTSRRRSEATKLSPALRHGIAYALCHAA